MGLENLVEFLNSKGIELIKVQIPNYHQRIMHFCVMSLLDQDLKEKSKAVLSNRERRESLSIKDAKESDKPLKEDSNSTYEDSSSKAREEVHSIKVPEKDVKVVGKIDLDSLNQKSKTEKKLEENTSEEPSQTEDKKTESSKEESREPIETIKIESKKFLAQRF